MTKPVLYDYWRSSASYRVRIALNLKNVAHEHVPISLIDGAQGSADYRKRNPQGLVPMLEADGHNFTQSLAIIEWLESQVPEPRLFPTDPAERAHVMAMTLAIACDIHPLNNLRVLKKLSQLGIDEETRNDWYRHWVLEGFQALEALAAPRAGTYLFGDTVTVADLFLVPQMYNARRFSVPVESYPTLARADEAARALDAFAAADPQRLAPEAASG